MSIIIEPKPVEQALIPRNDYPAIRGLLDRLGIKVLKRTMQSDNYEAGVEGWKLSEALAEFENVLARGNLNRNDFHWTTIFESLDGFGTGGDVPVISAADVKLTTGGLTGNTSSLRKTLNLPFYYFNWGFDRRFRTRIEFENNAAQEIWILSGAITTNKHIGFKVIDGVLYGTVADGTTESTLNCGAVSTSNDGMALDVVFEAGVGCTFIVDGVTKGTITTNLPSGVGFAQYMLELYIETTEDVAKEISLSFWDFWQSV